MDLWDAFQSAKSPTSALEFGVNSTSVKVSKLIKRPIIGLATRVWVHVIKLRLPKPDQKPRDRRSQRQPVWGIAVAVRVRSTIVLDKTSGFGNFVNHRPSGLSEKYSRGRIWTSDLRVMSPSPVTAKICKKLFFLYGFGFAVQTCPKNNCSLNWVYQNKESSSNLFRKIVVFSQYFCLLATTENISIPHRYLIHILDSDS